MPDLPSRIRTLLNLHANESRMASLVIGAMLLTSAGFTLGSTGVEALFFARFGVEYLPYMYMILGTLSFLTSLGITALLGRVRRENLFIFIPIGIAILTVIAWMVLFSRINFVYPVLWLGKEVINSLISLVVWGIAGTVCDTRQSKRLFPLFNAGRILGAVLGGLVTGTLVSRIGTQNLLLVWAGLLILAFVFIRALMKDRVPAEPARPSHHKQKGSSLIQEMQQGYRFVRGSALMRWVSMAAILFSVLYFSIALPFSKSATMQFPDENALAGFLGLFNGLSTAAAFLASILIANRLYARLGIMNAILALPIIYLLGFGSLTISNAFTVIILFRFIQMVWLSGIADSAYQVMFNTIPERRRDQVRAFIDGVPSQAGVFIAGIVLFIGEQAFSSQQLAVVGLVTAAATIFAIWRARHAYTYALVDALRNGRSTLFAHNDRIGQQHDATLIQTALSGMRHSDPVVRRVSTEILGGISTPETEGALVNALQDQDMVVQITALKGLAGWKSTSALLDIAALLDHPQPALRAQAVDSLRALTPYPRGLSTLLIPLLNDEDAQVQVRAIVALLSIDPSHLSRNMLRRMSMLGNVDERVMALYALAEVGDPDALILFADELSDAEAPIEVRSASASALASCGTEAIPVLKQYLASENSYLRERVAAALGKIGEPALREVVNALDGPASEQGALMALEQLPAGKEAQRIKRFAQQKIASALYYEDLRISISPPVNERIQLLSDALSQTSKQDGIYALKALGLLSDHETISAAIENLQSQSHTQHSNALETLETIKKSGVIRPLLRVFEPDPDAKPVMSEQQALAKILAEKDQWIRACGRFAMEPISKDKLMETNTDYSIMEHVLLLRRVPLLAVLPLTDLQRVAGIASERNFTDGEVICEEGEPGDELYVIVSGAVLVLVKQHDGTQKEIARRKAGDVVGEMSIITGDNRNATLVASGDVHVLSLDRLNFESLMRERPEVSLAIMRQLCNRLKQLSHWE